MTDGEDIWCDVFGEDWITDKTVNTIEEVKAFEGFEANSIYVEQLDIQVVANATHKFYLGGLTFLIKSDTTFKQCVDASGGAIDFGTPYEHMDGTTIAIYEGNNGGTLCLFSEGSMIPIWMCGAIGETQTVLGAANWQEQGYFAFAKEEDNMFGSLSSVDFNTIKEECEENGYLFGYIETID